jgi:proteasome accessory factor B
LAGTYFHVGIQTALQKIRGVLSESSLRHLEKMASALHCHAPGVSNSAPQARLIDDLQHAIEDQRLTVIEYQSLRATEPVTHYDLHPYGLAWHNQAFHLIAWSLDHDTIRTSKVDRISAVESKKLKFTRPADFSLQDYLQNSFGIMRSNAPPQRIVVRFAPKAARLFQEKTFHPSQQVTREPTGQILVTFTLSSLEELRSWLLSWGPLAEVLEPATLREKLRESLKQSLQKYQPAEETQRPSQSQGKRRKNVVR